MSESARSTAALDVGTAPGVEAPTTVSRLTRGGLAAYALLRAPLALLELPLFVLLPAYYAERLGMDLSVIGAVLFLARLIDAVADPAIGVLLDRGSYRLRYRRAILWALPVLALGYVAVFHPPPGVSLPAWLAIASVVTYLAYSVVSIAYQAWGARLGSGHERIRVTASREAAGLVGVLASASLLVPDRAGWLVGLFCVSAALAGLAIRWAPLPTEPVKDPETVPTTARAHFLESWQVVSGNLPFRWLLTVFLCNGIASAIPATLVLFFVSDVLGVPDRAPLFLIAYFLAAAVGMPIWVAIARRTGLRNAWLGAMGLSVLAFIWAFGLGPGDSGAFLAICLSTGFALGADLAVPPALLATLLASGPEPTDRRDGSFFGVWNLVTKLNLAAAAGLALPVLGALGYRPGEADQNTIALSMTYALLPCVLKLLAMAVLLRAPLPREAAAPSVREPITC